MPQKLSIGIIITANIILSIVVLFLGFLFWAMYSRVTLFVNPVGASLLLLVLFISARYIVKANRMKQIYVLGLQYYLFVAVLIATNDIYRGMYYTLKGDAPLFGISDVPLEMEELYETVSLYFLFTLPLPHWDWTILFTISVLALLGIISWMFYTIRKVKNSSAK